jgi:hypothetical protein
LVDNKKKVLKRERKKKYEWTIEMMATRTIRENELEKILILPLKLTHTIRLVFEPEQRCAV